jgi:transcription elongation factor Elf1
MDNTYSRIVKITADILKSWKPDSGTVSPFSSSSSNHKEESDNHTEYYIKKPSVAESVDISSMFNSDLFTNGGEKMTDKTLDVNASETTNASYTNPGSSTTEPDPQSNIAITKSAEIPTTHVGTTANTTEEAPTKGETTEPMEKAADCPDCGKPMTMCMCDGMSKSANCPHCGQAMPVEKTVDGAPVVSAETAPDHEAAGFGSIAKAADEEESASEEAAETAEDEKKEEMKKSLWGGAFSPSIIGKL